MTPTNQQDEKYMYVAPHIVGNAEVHGYCYDTDNVKFSTLKKAVNHGLKTLEHDDFWVAEMKGDRVIKLYNRDAEARVESEKEVNDVNDEFGV